MSRPVTEIATIPVHSGADVDDTSSPTAKILRDTVTTLTQQEGYQRTYIGRQVENPNVLQVFVDWDSVDAHKKFEAQPYYGPFVKHLLSAVDGEMVICHAEFSPHPPAAAVSGTSSVTEVVGHYFAADLSDSEKSTFAENVNKFAKILKDEAEGFTGFAGGWVIEEQEHAEAEGKLKLWQSCIGWQSVEAHMAFRETKAFKDNVYLMRPESKKTSTMHHTMFREA